MEKIKFWLEILYYLVNIVCSLVSSVQSNKKNKKK